MKDEGVKVTRRNSNRDLIDLEVQRRLTDALASAGVPQGRLSLEVLYMLPPSFVRGYSRLFDTALEESVRSGLGNADAGRRSVKRTGALRDSGKGASRNGDGSIKTDNRRAVVQVGSGGGKRFVRRHWAVKDEDALKIKDSLDRKLQRVIDTAFTDLRKLRDAKATSITLVNGGASEDDVDLMGTDDETTYRCFNPNCGMDHTPLVRLLSRMRERGAEAPLRYCPRCGQDLG